MIDRVAKVYRVALETVLQKYISSPIRLTPVHTCGTRHVTILCDIRHVAPDMWHTRVGIISRWEGGVWCCRRRQRDWRFRGERDWDFFKREINHK